MSGPASNAVPMLYRMLLLSRGFEFHDVLIPDPYKSRRDPSDAWQRTLPCQHI
jgi:hypothetical protein